jgi:hypothetical protein
MAETVQAMKLAQAAKELGRIIGAANEARADCLRVEMLAQIRIAREYDEAKARGEVAKADGTTHHRPKEGVHDADTLPATIPELGLDRRRVAEWRKMAEAGEDVVFTAIDNALAEGREATAADVKRAIAGGPVCGLCTGNFEWYTPAKYIEAARRVMGGIDLDPASHETAQRTVRAAEYFTKDDDGLSRPWRGRVWCNPPYATGLIERFAAKLVEEFKAGNVLSAIMLTDNKTDTKWFHALLDECKLVCFTLGLINFYNETNPAGSHIYGSAFTYFGHDGESFANAFGGFGAMVARAAA